MTTPHARFSIRRFLLLVSLQFSLLMIAGAYLLPNLWARQLAAGPAALILTFLVALLGNTFFEWWFHRYVLHATIHPALARFSRAHRHHHSLTPIKLRPNEVGPGRIIINRYPITDVMQNEGSAFPPYALVVFWLVFTPPLIGAQLLFPNVPIMLGGYAAVTWSMVSYEVFHAIEHYPYEWWKSAVEHPRYGWLWRKVYGFHHFHHANISANEAISGWFGLPIADWVLRTYHQPQELLLEGRLATAKEFHVRPGHPWLFVARADTWARQQEKNIVTEKRIAEKSNGIHGVRKILRTGYRRLTSRDFDQLMAYPGTARQLWEDFQNRKRNAPKRYSPSDFVAEYIRSKRSLQTA